MKYLEMKETMNEHLKCLSHQQVNITMMSHRRMDLLLKGILSTHGKLLALEKFRNRYTEKEYRLKRIYYTSRRLELLRQLLRIRYHHLRERPLFSLMG